MQLTYVGHVINDQYVFQWPTFFHNAVRVIFSLLYSAARYFPLIIEGVQHIEVLS